MKYQIAITDPDALTEALTGMSENDMWKSIEASEKWMDVDGTVTIEIDTETGGARVVEVVE